MCKCVSPVCLRRLLKLQSPLLRPCCYPDNVFARCSHWDLRDMTSCSYLGGAAGKLTAADEAAAWGCSCGQVPPAAELSHPEEIRHACTNTSFLSYLRTATQQEAYLIIWSLLPMRYWGQILRAIMSNTLRMGLDSRRAPYAQYGHADLFKNVSALNFMLPSTHTEL